MTDALLTSADQLIAMLRQQNRRIVFAESCTAGLVAATLGRTPGISDHLCGSAVVYREATKTAWLGVSAADLSNPDITAVSRQVATAMVLGVLARTPEADVAASITGYLGPDSAPQMDGVAWIGVAIRLLDGTPHVEQVRRVELNLLPDRCARQREAARLVLQLTAETLQQIPSR